MCLEKFKLLELVQVLKWHLGPAESHLKEQKMKKKKKQQAEKD